MSEKKKESVEKTNLGESRYSQNTADQRALDQTISRAGWADGGTADTERILASLH